MEKSHFVRNKVLLKAGSYIPLADLLRPKTLKDFVDQEHLVGKNGIIRKLIESDQLVSMIFWGPPGSGKTTLARPKPQKTVPPTTLILKL